MTKTIHGWNDIPAGYVQEVDFHLAPIWLRALARTTYFERFAYPIAVKKGLVKRWKIEPDEVKPEFFWSDGIQYFNADYPGFKHSSPIEFEMKKTRIKFPFFILRLISILILTKTFTQILFFGLFGTKWGRDRKTTYIKEKINAQKK